MTTSTQTATTVFVCILNAPWNLSDPSSHSRPFSEVIDFLQFSQNFATPSMWTTARAFSTLFNFLLSSPDEPSRCCYPISGLLLTIILICSCSPPNLEAITPCKPHSAADCPLANTVNVISLKILGVLLHFRTRSTRVEKNFVRTEKKCIDQHT